MRQVIATQKDPNGDILALCGGSSAIWSPRSKQDAIQDIETGGIQYFVDWGYGHKTGIHVVNGPTGKYLRTDKDNTTRNNLDDLPDC